MVWFILNGKDVITLDKKGERFCCSGKEGEMTRPIFSATLWWMFWSQIGKRDDSQLTKRLQAYVPDQG